MASHVSEPDLTGDTADSADMPSDLQASFSVFEIGVLLLALISPFLSPYLYELSPEETRILIAADWVISGIFLFKFFVDLIQAESRLAFLKWGWVDLIAATPVLPFIHSLRLLRLIRLVRLIRSVRTIAQQRALLRSLFRRRAESAFATILLLTVLSLFGSALVILHFETDQGNITTAADALWWAFVTITTVGYGDYYPVTPQGRIVAALLAVVGIGLFGVFTGWLASWLMKPLST